MNIPNLETLVVFTVITVAGAGFLNGLFICLYGIQIMDKRLSAKPDYRWESASPFHAFERMHKYSFSHTFFRKKTTAGIISGWLFFTCFTLIAYWFVFLASAVAYYFEADFIKILSFGLSTSS